MLGVFYFYFFRVALLPYSPRGGEDAVLPSSQLRSSGGTALVTSGALEGLNGPTNVEVAPNHVLDFLLKSKLKLGIHWTSQGLPGPPSVGRLRAAPNLEVTSTGSTKGLHDQRGDWERL